MSRKFQRSDVVKLRSGGPLMVVERYSDSFPDEIECIWFPYTFTDLAPIEVWDAEPRTSRFFEECLLLVTRATEEEEETDAA